MRSTLYGWYVAVALLLMLAGSPVSFAQSPSLSEWIAERAIKPGPTGLKLPAVMRLATIDGAGATQPPFDLAEVSASVTLEFARASDIVFGQKLNSLPVAKPGVKKALNLRALGLADAAIYMPRAAWSTSPWAIQHQGGAAACPPVPLAANETLQEAFYTRLTACLGYNAIVIDVKGENVLAISLRSAMIKGLKGLLIKDSASRMFVPANTKVGDGQMKIVDFQGPYALLRRQIESSTLIEVGSKIDFEKVDLPTSKH